MFRIFQRSPDLPPGRAVPIRHRIDFVEDQVPDVIVCVSGEMTVEGLRAWLAELVGHPRWRPGMKTLVDATALTPGAFAGGDVQAPAVSTAADKDQWGAGFSAFMVVDPTVFGLLRMWQVATRDREWQTGVFHSRDEALAWLASTGR